MNNHRYRIEDILFIIYSAFIIITGFFMSKGEFIYFLRWSALGVIVIVATTPFLLKSIGKLKIRNIKGIRVRYLTIASICIPFFSFILMYLIFYPGGFSPDSIVQYTQVVNNSYNDWHPVLQTLLAFTLPLSLTGGWIGSIVLFQIVFMSAAFAYAICAVYKYTNLTYTVFSMLFMILNPNVLSIAMYPWKDTTFAIGALFLTGMALHIWFSNGLWLDDKKHIVLLIIIISVTTIVRHNAILFTLPFMIAIFFRARKRQTIIISLCVVLLIAAIKGPVYSALHVEKAGMRQVETLGLPMTVIGAVATYDPDALDDETKEFVYRVAPPSTWSSRYTYGNYNSVKWADETDNDVIEEYGRNRILAMMFRCIRQSPSHAMKGLIRLTDVVYTIQDDYHYSAIPDVIGNEYGIQMEGIPVLQRVYAMYRAFCMVFFPHLFMYYGSMHLILIASILAKCHLNRLKDWSKILFAIPLLAYNFGTTLLLTGAGDSVRFFFYTFLLIPLLLVLFYREEEGNS